MKKIVFMLTVVACAASIQAAQMKWGTGSTGINLPGTSTKITASNVAYYFYSANVADPWSSKATVTGEGDAAVYALATSDAFTKTVSKGVATITDGSTYGSGDTAYAAVILTYDKNGDGKIGVGDYYMVGTGSYSFEADANKTSNLTMGSWTEITSTGGGGEGGGVPEPTSGLLLLVGAGVLGLRRKRA